VTIVLALVAGTILAMWLGELITEYGVGNGVSMIIFAGILGRVPSALASQVSTGGSSQVGPIVGLGVILILVTAFIIYVQQAQRKVPMQSAQRIVNPRSGMGTQGGRRNFLPLRINSAGVIPIIFALQLMQIPALFANIFSGAAGWAGSVATWIHNYWQPINGPSVWIEVLYNLAYFALVFGFTYFYTAIVFDPNDVADNMKKSAQFIPGIRPGKLTAEYLGRLMGRLTFFGAIFLALITVVLPLLTEFVLNQQGSTLYYLGGTSILIVVSVALDTMKQLESQLQMRQYRGFIR
jgi:preprotein translocase subunit SecY